MTASARRTNAIRITFGPTASFFVSTFLLLAVSLPTTLMLATTSARALEAGERAPDFAAPALGGKGTVSLAQYRGKVVYLDFWASWCAPCLKAIPEIEGLRKELASAGLQVVAVNLDTTPKKALRF